MAFASVADFLAMGGHGLYVWLAYGVSFFVLAANVVAPLLERRRLLVEMAAEAATEARRAGTGAEGLAKGLAEDSAEGSEQ